jgi:hypothetical protein
VDNPSITPTLPPFEPTEAGAPHLAIEVWLNQLFGRPILADSFIVARVGGTNLPNSTEAGAPHLAFEMWALFPKGTRLQPLREISEFANTALNLKHHPASKTRRGPRPFSRILSAQSSLWIVRAGRSCLLGHRVSVEHHRFALPLATANRLIQPGNSPANAFNLGRNQPRCNFLRVPPFRLYRKPNALPTIAGTKLITASFTIAISTTKHNVENPLEVFKTSAPIPLSPSLVPDERSFYGIANKRDGVLWCRFRDQEGNSG